MVRQPLTYRRVLLCMLPEDDHETQECYRRVSCDSMFSEDTLDRDACSRMEECEHLAEDMNLDTDADWTQILDNQPIVLNDRMMTDAVQSPHIQSEHSYSLTLNDELPQSPFGLPHNIKLEDYSKDMETECFPAVSMTSATGQSDFAEDVLIKQEPPSPSPPPQTPSPTPMSPPPSAAPRSTISSLLSSPPPPVVSSVHPQSLLKQPTIVLATRPSLASSRDHQLVFPKVNIKLEPQITTTGFPLPPTPPSCNGSDSDGSLSPVHGPPQPASPPALLGGSPTTTSGTSMGRKTQKVVLSVTTTSPSSSSKSTNSQSSLISSQPKGATGVLLLTEEEKRTLLAEGYPIPQRLPLTKAEERSLKKIRRKIKNKISAQESRRKKKEYMDALEKKVDILTNENIEYKKKLDTLEGSNKSLMSQLQHLQAILGDIPNKRCRNVATQTFPSSSTIALENMILKSLKRRSYNLPILRSVRQSELNRPVVQSSEVFDITDAKGR